ncbi:Putative mycofactocin biosynthesis glycosyltransferase MftF [Thermoflexales bacterium]|nr:Putative mycofactocin biosynthesis glycosyltransferase MftF [Thermoflexales bacterium]
MRYSVIVPAYQAAALLPRCLNALQQQTIDRTQYEIIVVDDGSTDNTAEVAEQTLRDFPAARVIRAKHGGPAKARNLGACEAQGDLLLFTDADCEPVPAWIEQFARAFADPAISGAKGAYRTRQRSLIARFVQQEYQERYDYTQRRSTIDFIDTYSAGYRRKVFVENRGFDALFPTASVEDQEFSFRLAARGHRLIFVPEALVYHQHNTTLTRYFRRKFSIGYWKMYLLKRHPGKAVRDSHTPQIVKAQIVLLAMALLTTLAGWRLPIGSVLPIGLWIIFGLTMLPLLTKIARRDLPVLLVAPLMIFARTLALGLGLFCGALRFYGLQRKPAP